ncbi:hypothetical protein Fot_44459 [Forsythia ovata]|uniref:Uncharacterized protein n=1 Tax=Forsythia ovata TaxID=205694 RepID=A0ABD1R3L0_9LAMI
MEEGSTFFLLNIEADGEDRDTKQSHLERGHVRESTQLRHLGNILKSRHQAVDPLAYPSHVEKVYFSQHGREHRSSRFARIFSKLGSTGTPGVKPHPPYMKKIK